jgi:phosphate-selective porin OprO/OprP
LAVPLNYADSARWNRFDGNYVSGIFAAAVILDRTRFVVQEDSSLGYRYSNAREDGGTATGPELNQAPDYVAAKFADLDSLETYHAEASLRSGPLWFHGEWLQTTAEPNAGESQNLDGYHLTASLFLTGKVRSYNKKIGIFGNVPIARTVNHQGWGAWEISARFSHLDLSENMGDLTHSEFPAQDGGVLDIWSTGINWWLSPYFNGNLNYRYITLDR